MHEHISKSNKWFIHNNTYRNKIDFSCGSRVSAAVMEKRVSFRFEHDQNAL